MADPGSQLSPSGAALLQERHVAWLGLLSLALLLAVAGLVEHERAGGIDLYLVALGVSLVAPAFHLALATRERLPRVPRGVVALDLAAIGVFLAWPDSPFCFALAGAGALILARTPTESSPQASALEEACVLAFALAPAALCVHAGALRGERGTGLPLSLTAAAVLAIAAYRPGRASSVGDAGRRASGFALTGASALANTYEPWSTGATPGAVLLVGTAILLVLTIPRMLVETDARARARVVGALALLGAEALYRATIDTELALVLAVAVAFATLPERLASRGVLRVTWPAVILLTIGRELARRPLPVVASGGVLAAWLAVAALASAVFFAVARAMDTPPARPGTLATILATILATLTAVEGGLRIKQRDNPDLVLDAVTPLVGLNSFALLFEGAGDRTDYRGHVFSPSKPPGVYRIALLGASSAWGHAQKERAESLAGRIEARAPELAGRRTEVLCLACPGFTSDQELALVAAHALDWDVDLFLALDGYNDINFLSGRETYPGDVYSWPQHRLGLGFPVRRWLVRRSLLLRPLLTRGALVDARPAPFEPANANGFFEDGIVADEQALATLASDAGSTFVWSFVPLSYDRPSPGPGEERPEARAREVSRRKAAVRGRVEPAVAARGGIVLDLTARLRERSLAAPSEKWFVDECHYTDRGTDVLAEELLRALVPALAERR